MPEKEFIRADDLIRDAFTLAKRIYDSGYRPDALLVLWRGGTPVGIAIHEFLMYKGVRTYHTAIKAESYTGIGKRIDPVIENLEPVLQNLKVNAKVLIVDDIFDTGCTMQKVCERVRERTCQIKIATLYYKDGASRVDIVPDYFLRKTNHWLVFPHELMDLTADEIRAKDEYIYNLLA